LQPPTTSQEGQGSVEQNVQFSGTSNAANPSQITFQYDGVNATLAVPYVSGVSPTATQVEQALKTIPELANGVKVINAPGVTALGGGPFTVIFNGNLAGTAAQTL